MNASTADQSATFGEYLPTASEMGELDRLVMQRRGVSSLQLMEEVGREFARRIELLIRACRLRNRSVTVLVGPGNNGGDGLVVAPARPRPPALSCYP